MLLVAAGLVALARRAAPPARPGTAARRSAWAAGLCAFGVGLAWFALAAVAYVAPPVPALIPIAAGLVLAVAGVLVARRWSGAHPLALIAGALAASMLAGFLVSGARTPPDLIGKLVLDVAAVAALLWLGRRLAGAGPPAATAAHYGDAAPRPAPRHDDHR